MQTEEQKEKKKYLGVEKLETSILGHRRNVRHFLSTLKLIFLLQSPSYVFLARFMRKAIVQSPYVFLVSLRSFYSFCLNSMTPYLQHSNGRIQ